MSHKPKANSNTLQASGNLGYHITQALLSSGFTVTAVTRESSTSTFPAEVQVRTADLSSLESLTKAFAGQDAVICNIATSEAGNQKFLADAAVAAGMKRFIPSEFGFNTRPGKISHPVVEQLPYMVAKKETVDYLEELAAKNLGFTWTGLATNMWLDWALDRGLFPISPFNRSAAIYDSGNGPISACTLDFIGQAVVAILQREQVMGIRRLLNCLVLYPKRQA
ncbi:hypothetical protein QBC32DRAFT_103024 [Pseudoneurospora amorphoporcata]|uniref:NmrA-like domain-containing protein n=1 Tax=Pseudoneurospora amorphoporcata TaxID=241081 RepID=A0AAN6SBQ0_9PEZI|nr:hypothetical protein QBC32DRAFT_103024 [Pseudoneurospora amorphoporcata]